eukprot:jgi/Tetstr1/444681/TSEL_032529.t1
MASVIASTAVLPVALQPDATSPRCPHHKARGRGPLRVVARAAGGRGGGRGGSGRGAGPPRQRPDAGSGSKGGKAPPVPLPEYGYFAQADTKAPVYAPLAGRESGDVTKRGGRWSNDFIWNTNWAEQLDYQDKLKQDREQAEKEARERSESGAISFSRVGDLGSMDVDLSEQLSRPKAEQSLPSVNIPILQPKARPGQKTRVREVYAPPSQGEARRWGRSNRFAKKVVKVVTTDEDDAEAAEARRLENERYAELKKQLQLANAGLTATLFAATFAFYPTNVAYSYLMGAAGGAQYLRMLNQSVESYGSSSVGGALGQQRVLIPVILALAFNRFNELASESTGVTLQLLPMLAGFFTYKLSVIARSSYDLYKNLSTDYGAKEAPKPAGGAGGKSIGEQYAERILKG